MVGQPLAAQHACTAVELSRSAAAHVFPDCEYPELHEVTAQVPSSCLFIGFELVADRASKKPDKLALDVIERLRDLHVLTSVAGPYGNVLKLRPPLAFKVRDVDWLVGALDQALADCNGGRPKRRWS